jgi:hypothetical protein
LSASSCKVNPIRLRRARNAEAIGKPSGFAADFDILGVAAIIFSLLNPFGPSYPPRSLVQSGFPESAARCESGASLTFGMMLCQAPLINYC